MQVSVYQPGTVFQINAATAQFGIFMFLRPETFPTKQFEWIQ